MSEINYSGKQLAELFAADLAQQEFDVRSVGELVHFTYKGEDYYAFLRVISYAGNPHPKNRFRAQMPKRPYLESYKDNGGVFLFVGYDQVKDVYVIWNPYSIRPRINQKETVSLFCDEKALNNAQEERICWSKLPNGGLYVAFDIKQLFVVLDNLIYFQDETPIVPQTATSVDVTSFINSMIKNDCSTLEIMEACMNKFATDFPEWDYMMWRRTIVCCRNSYEEEESEPIVEEKQEHLQLSEEDIERRFIQYLHDRGISKSSVKKYAFQVPHNTDVQEIVKKYTGKDSLFSVISLDDLDQILSEIKSAPFNVRGRDMYYYGVSHYMEYVSSEVFQRSASAEFTAENENQYVEFLNDFIRYNKQVNGPFADSKGSKAKWLGKWSLGIKSVSIEVVIGKKRCRTEIYINTGNKEENKRIFDLYYSHKQEVEKEIKDIVWQRLDNKDASRIRVDKQLSFLKPEDKEEIFQFFITTTENFQRVFAKFAPEYLNYENRQEGTEQKSSNIWSKLKNVLHWSK